MRFGFLIFIGIIFYLPPTVIRAEIIFTEIMYDLEGSDTDGEWVEVYNTGNDSFDLSGYKFNDGSNHGLNIPPANGGQGSLTLLPGDYMIITDNAELFLIDHPAFANSVIDTVMSLTNTSDILSIVNPEGVSISTVSYTSDLGANGDGLSLNFVNGVWVPGPQSPGLSGSGSVVEEDEDDNNEDSTQSSGDAGASESSSMILSSPSIDMTTIPKSGVVGVPFIVKTNVFGYQKEPIRSGRFVWTFGDGNRKEISYPEPFQYVYENEGEYVVTFEYFQNPYALEPFVFAQTNIIVSPGGIVISAVEKDGTIVLENKGTTPRDLGGWSLVSGNTSFFIPKYTVVLPRKKLVLSSSVTLLGNASNISVSLKNPIGVVTSIFPEEKIAQQKVSSEKSYSQTTKKPQVLGESINLTQNSEFFSADVSVDEKNSKTKNPKLWSLFGLIMLGAIAVVSVRRISGGKGRKVEESDPSNDFELVE